MVRLLAREACLQRFLASLLRAVILAAAISASGHARGETAPLAVTEIAPEIFVHNGVQQDASPANDDEIANALVDPAKPVKNGGNPRVLTIFPGCGRSHLVQGFTTIYSE